MTPGRGPALVVFAKAPEAGKVKTRMCPPFTLAQARDFYACMLDDVLELTGRTARALGAEPVLAVTPESALPAMARRAPAGFLPLAQRGPDLSARMEAAVADLVGAGFGPVVLRGSDSPCLGAGLIAAALSGLEGSDLVVSPDPDGGYSLIGLRSPAPGLFDHPMSTGSVLRDTLCRAEALGLAVRELEAGFDIDTAEDLGRLAEACAGDCEAPCGRTLAFLEREGIWPGWI